MALDEQRQLVDLEQKWKERWDAREKDFQERWHARKSESHAPTLSQAQFQVQWDARVKLWHAECDVRWNAREKALKERWDAVCVVCGAPRSQAPPVIGEASGPWTDWPSLAAHGSQVTGHHGIPAPDPGVLGFQHGAGTGVPVSWSPGAQARCQSALSGLRGAIASLNLV